MANENNSERHADDRGGRVPGKLTAAGCRVILAGATGIEAAMFRDVLAHIEAGGTASVGSDGFIALRAGL